MLKSSGPYFEMPTNYDRDLYVVVTYYDGETDSYPYALQPRNQVVTVGSEFGKLHIIFG